MAMVTFPSYLKFLPPSSSSSSSSLFVCRIGQRSSSECRKHYKCFPAARAEIKEEEGKPSSTVVKESSSNFKAPEPKRFYVRGDKFLDILGSSLALPMRLGSGALAQGYVCMNVSTYISASTCTPHMFLCVYYTGMLGIYKCDTHAQGFLFQQWIVYYQWEVSQ